MSGISSGSDVQLLRNLFRSTVSEGVPVDLGNLCQLCIDLYSTFASKTVELQALVKKNLDRICRCWSQVWERGFSI
jgi:hypothetical protein